MLSFHSIRIPLNMWVTKNPGKTAIDWISTGSSLIMELVVKKDPLGFFKEYLFHPEYRRFE